MKILLLGIFMVFMFRRVTSNCDKTAVSSIVEGNLGQAYTYPWLGVLRVYLQGVDKAEVALSGLVLVRSKHALVNADDVSKIPKELFRRDTRAMFMVAEDTPWYCWVNSYSTHPEYEVTTTNTLAIVELNMDNVKYNPLMPICWNNIRPSKALKHLYVVGYTDDNQILEKVIHKMQYVEKRDCDNFYETAGLVDLKRVPTHYLCGWSPSTRAQCVWDNGMVLVSKANKRFTLIGFGVHGPGCTAPARFIDMARYYNWVENYITVQNEQKIAKVDEEPDNVPLHELFHENPFRRGGSKQGNGTTSNVTKSSLWYNDRYPFATDRLHYFHINATDNALEIHPFNDTYESRNDSCQGWKILMYREYFELTTKTHLTGLAYYKVSLYDLYQNKCTCVKMKIDSTARSQATLSVREVININTGAALRSSEETPDKYMKHYLINEIPIQTGIRGPKMKPKFIFEPQYKVKRKTYDLYVRFTFADKAVLTVEMYSEAVALTTSTATARRASGGLTSAERRLSYLKQRRTKMTRPPGRKMWYDEDVGTRTIRSGFVESIPEAVSQTFAYRDDNTFNLRISKTKAPRYVKGTVKFLGSTDSPVSVDDIHEYVKRGNEPVQTKPAALDTSAPIDASLLAYQGSPKPIDSVPEIIILVLTFHILVKKIIFKI